MSDCVFCKIVAGEIPCAKVRENDQFVAILDAFPACKWQTLVLPKNHYSSDIFVLEDALYSSFLLATKHMSQLLKIWFWVERVGMVMEGLQVPHSHIKLYPFREGKSFEWWLTSHTMADIHQLQAIAEEIQQSL